MKSLPQGGFSVFKGWWRAGAGAGRGGNADAFGGLSFFL